MNQVSSEVCRAFGQCQAGRSDELLSHYMPSPCPTMPAVQQDRSDDKGDSSDSDEQPSSTQVYLTHS